MAFKVSRIRFLSGTEKIPSGSWVTWGGAQNRKEANEMAKEINERFGVLEDEILIVKSFRSERRPLVVWWIRPRLSIERVGI